MRPSTVDSIVSTPEDPPGWHVRETTEDGYPLMGSSPAERAEAVERIARIKAQAMRDHPFVGEGPYCQARISFAPMGGPDTGTITGWAGCGYPRDAHPEGPVIRQLPRPERNERPLPGMTAGAAPCPSGPLAGRPVVVGLPTPRGGWAQCPTAPM